MEKSMNTIGSFLQDIQKKGLKIDTVYDTGACVGNWAKQMKNTVLFDSNFFLFEALPDHEEALKETGLPYIIGVLSNPGRESVDFYVGKDTGDSYYKENTGHYDERKATTFPCYTLQNIVEENDLPLPNFIKIDTQGSEIDILKGFEKYLEAVDLIYLECPIIQYNLGAPGLQQYLEYMKSKKFIPVDLLQIHNSENTLLQIDIMFMREEVKVKYLGPNKYIRPLD
jgi:FkbM family methyltransferase